MSDENNRRGFFILTGSHQLELHASISQSLAGRTAILKLLPFSIAELIPIEIKASRTFHPEFLEGIHYFIKITANRSPTVALVYAGDQEQCIHKIHVCNYKNIEKLIDTLIG